MSNRRIGLIGALALALGPAFDQARADLLYFAQGGEVQLPAEVDGEVVRLEAPDGPHEFRLDDFRAIVPGHWPEREWPSRRDRAEAGDASERFRAAWWALEHGMTDEAAAMLRSAHQADPSLRPAARLVAVLDRLDQPARAPDLTALRKVLRGEFEVAEGPRFVLLHQHETSEAADRLELLDRVLTAFYLTFSAMGLELSVPGEKLVAVWFANEADYLAYIRKEAGEAFLTTRGYYHPTRRVVFVTDGRSRAESRRSSQALRDRLEELDRAEQGLSDVPASARFRLSLSGAPARTVDRESAMQLIDELRRETLRKQLLQDLERLRADQAAAVHEVIHQLVIASGLAPRYERFPVWLHEGLAMQFEGFRGGRWAGLSAVPAHRLDQWRRIRTPPMIEAIVRDEGFGRGYAADPYAAAWGLVYHLRVEHPEGFVALLDHLRNPAAGRDEDRGADAFRAAFGTDLGALRRDWIEGLRTLQAPIEAHRPPTGSSRRGNRR